jgi:hypothetical protein
MKQMIMITKFYRLRYILKGIDMIFGLLSQDHKNHHLVKTTMLKNMSYQRIISALHLSLKEVDQDAQT